MNELYISRDGIFQFIKLEEEDNGNSIGVFFSACRCCYIGVDKKDMKLLKKIGDIKPISFWQKIKAIYMILKM